MDPDQSTSGARYTTEEIQAACGGPLHPEALHGLELFNAGEYFEAHEALEQAWMEEPGPLRDLYRGILQVGVGYHHILRGNYNGARKMFMRCRQWLEPFPDRCCGINLARFRADFLSIEALVIRMGPERLHNIERHNFQPIHYSATPCEE